MMLFQRNSDLASIRNFYVSTGSGSQEKPIAYGPGSIINGTLMITTDKPIEAYNVRVVFKCEELDNYSDRQINEIFSVDTIIWGKSRDNSDSAQELSSGSHMYLFAIRLPQVNYPPTMRDPRFGHRISYSLQGVFDLKNASELHRTAAIPVLYLPLIVTNQPTSKTTQVFQKEDKKIEVIAELIKPAYCPGDLCTVKMITNNKSDTKITSVQVLLTAIATILDPDNADEYIQKKHDLVSEYFYISIPKHAKDHQDIFKFHIPPNCVPTFTNKMSKYIDISYQVQIVLPCSNQGGLFQGAGNVLANTITLPVIIATVPPSYGVQISIQESTNNNELPTFIPNIESPLPSPVHYPADRAYSVSPSNSFQMTDAMDISEEDAAFVLNESQIDSSGHLMVPDATRRKSASSELSETTLANSRIETIVS